MKNFTSLWGCPLRPAEHRSSLGRAMFCCNITHSCWVSLRWASLLVCGIARRAEHLYYKSRAVLEEEKAFRPRSGAVEVGGHQH